MAELATTLQCEGDALVAVTHVPELMVGDVGVLIIVGGPQYRVGSHRQFVLLARHVAAQGTPVMRFDYRGMGDSNGEFAGFERVETDIRAALDQFQLSLPAVRRFILWGLCDGASAAVMYAPTDPRVCGLVLVNPWVRTEAGLARSYLKGYYRQRLVSWEFWSKVLRSPAQLFAAARGLMANLSRARSGGGGNLSIESQSNQEHFLQRMLQGMQQFRGRAIVLLSGDDLVATEYRLLLAGDATWSRAFGPAKTETRELPGANHTFSTREWRNWVESTTYEFVATCRR